MQQFWTDIQSELVEDHFYRTSISRMRFRLARLHESDKEARKIRTEGLNGYEELDGVLYYQKLLFVPKVIWTEIISQYHNKPLVNHFGINKIKDLVGRKYYWPSFQRDIEAYVKGCDIYLGLKAVRHKPYNDLQSLPVPIHRWKNLSKDFVTGLPIWTYGKVTVMTPS